MAINIYGKKNLDLTKLESDNTVVDELINSVGASAFNLYHDRFFGSLDLKIHTLASFGGTKLIEDTDYILGGLDTELSGRAVSEVFSTITIIKASYQAVDLYFSYQVCADLVDGNDQYTIRPPTDIDFVVIPNGTGKIGLNTATPTLAFSFNEKIGFTTIGGLAIKLTNRTGAVTIAGQLVKPDTATDDGVILTGVSDVECTGVFLEAGIADDAETWVVVSGIADVAMKDNTAAIHGYWVETSDEAGYADSTSVSPAAAPQHFEEIGNCIESVSATGGGTHILARCILHFN